jgi:hypothetical protein
MDREFESGFCLQQGKRFLNSIQISSGSHPAICPMSLSNYVLIANQ